MILCCQVRFWAQNAFFFLGFFLWQQRLDQPRSGSGSKSFVSTTSKAPCLFFPFFVHLRLIIEGLERLRSIPNVPAANNRARPVAFVSISLALWLDKIILHYGVCCWMDKKARTCVDKIKAKVRVQIRSMPIMASSIHIHVREDHHSLPWRVDISIAMLVFCECGLINCILLGGLRAWRTIGWYRTDDYVDQ